MGAPLRLGIVGSGAMAAYHVKRFSSLDSVLVAATADRDPERAAAFGLEQGGLRVFPDVDSLAASGEVDAIAVSSRDFWHREPVLVALGRGLPVFCEKPLARSLAEATTMAEAARRSGLPAMVNFAKRNGGLLSLARSILAEGRLGPLRRADFSYLQSWLLQDSWGDWRTCPRWQWRLDEDLSCHGALGDLGSHLLDAALLLFGEAGVRRAGARRFSREAELPSLSVRPAWESVEAELALSQAGARLEASIAAPGCLDSFIIRIEGEAASLLIDLGRSRDSLLLDEGGLRVELRAPPLPTTYERFVTLARGGTDPLAGQPIDFDQGQAVQALIEATAAAAAAGEVGVHKARSGEARPS